MQIDQHIFTGSRAAANAAIAALWIVEALILLMLTIAAVAGIMGTADSPISSISTFALLFGIVFLAFLSFAFTGVCVAVIANAVSNIDSRNMQAQLFQLRTAPKNDDQRLTKYPSNGSDLSFTEFSGIRAERVT